MRNKALLIAIEGNDGSGKCTQALTLHSRLLEKGLKSNILSFPMYNDKSSTFIKMYLGGELSSNMNDISPYAASSFYAMDRYISYITKWKEIYDNPENIIVFDRYVYSNILHQASKLQNDTDIIKMSKWIYDYEFNKLGLPTADEIFYLNVPTEIRAEILHNRNNNKHSFQKDIHEEDPLYLKRVSDIGIKIAKTLNWKIINCNSGDKMRTIYSIHSEIYNHIPLFI